MRWIDGIRAVTGKQFLKLAQYKGRWKQIGVTYLGSLKNCSEKYNKHKTIQINNGNNFPYKEMEHKSERESIL